MSPMPKYAITYVAYWQDVFAPYKGVLKVGRAWKWHRLDMLTRSGAHIIVCARGTDWTWEAEALKVLRRFFPKAFNNAYEAEGVLFMGRGWTECFEVDEIDLQFALKLCFKGFAKGNDQGVNEQRATEDLDAGIDLEELPACADGGEADGAGVVADSGRAGSDGAHTGVDSGGDLSGASGSGVGDDAHSDVGRVRIPDDLPERGHGLGSVDAPAEGGRAACDVGVPTATGYMHAHDSRRFANVRGCGGRARESARAGRAGERAASEQVGAVGAGARANPQAGTSAAARCSADRLPGSPKRPVQRLRAMRHGTAPPRQMASANPLRRGIGSLREGDLA